MKVCLVLAPTWAFDKPQLGAAYLSSYLKSKGHEIKILDFNIELFRKEYSRFSRLWEDQVHILRGEETFFRLLYPERFKGYDLKDIARQMRNPKINLFSVKRLINKYLGGWVKRVLDTDAKVIGFSINSNTTLFSLLIAKEIKKRDKSRFIVFGGPTCHRNINANFFIKTGFVDAVVTAEGEETFADLIKQIDNFGKIKNCLGVIARKEGRIIDYGERPLIENPDSIPFPDYNGFNLDKYLFKNPRVLPFIMGRGCPYACNFCMDRVFWKKYRYRSVDNIIKEFKFNYDKYGVKDFGFNDLTINANLDLLRKLSEGIIKEKLEITWAGTARFVPGINRQLLKNMKRAGCVQIDYGLESASDSVRKRMNKFGYNKVYTSNVLKTSHELGIKQALLLIIGYIGETKEEFADTLNFVLKNKKYLKEIHPGSLYIIKGTPLYEFKEKFGVKFHPRMKFKNEMNFWKEYYYPDYNWYTDDPDDTLQNRMKRLELFKRMLEKKGIEHNLSGEELMKVVKNEISK